MHNTNKLLRIFEKVVFLYLEDTLPEEERKFWDAAIEANPQLKNMLLEKRTVLTAHKELPVPEISDILFSEMIEKAQAGQDNTISLPETKKAKPFPWKVAVATACIIALLILGFEMFNKAEPKKKIEIMSIYEIRSEMKELEKMINESSPKIDFTKYDSKNNDYSNNNNKGLQ